MTEMAATEPTERILGLLGACLSGHPSLTLEFSVQMTPGAVATRGRFACWLGGTGQRDFEPIRDALERLGAPTEAVDAQRTASRPLRQAIAIGSGAGGPQLRLYLHAQDGGAATYRAYRWRPGGTITTSRYEFHYFPETPDGRKPIELAAPLFRPALARLMSDRRLTSASGFWLREDPVGGLEQVDLAYPWQPRVDTLAGADALAERLDVELPATVRALNVRHVAVSAGARSPSVNFYASARWNGDWPATEEALQAGVRERAALTSTAGTPPVIPDAPARSVSLVAGRPRDASDPAAWGRVLGPHMRTHFGDFEGPIVPGRVPDADELEQATARAVRGLYRFIPAGSRVYVVHCGWGGAEALLALEHRCLVLGVTPSRAQYRFVASRGLAVRLGDPELVEPPGRFECALLLESLQKIRDPRAFLGRLRTHVGRLVMRVPCPVARLRRASPGWPTEGGESIADARSVPSRLFELLDDAGFTVVEWRQCRRQTTPTLRAWQKNMSSEPPSHDPEFERFRAWLARVAPRAEVWGRLNGLVEVVAD